MLWRGLTEKAASVLGRTQEFWNYFGYLHTSKEDTAADQDKGTRSGISYKQVKNAADRIYCKWVLFLNAVWQANFFPYVTFWKRRA